MLSATSSLQRRTCQSARLACLNRSRHTESIMGTALGLGELQKRRDAQLMMISIIYRIVILEELAITIMIKLTISINTR
jgi:hypothetical protein